VSELRLRLPQDSGARELDGYDRPLLTEMYRRMVLIRFFEERANELFLQGVMPGTIHLSDGQEAVAVGTCLALEGDDLITLTHRGHGQALAKGVEPRALMAELFGRDSGCCRGRGGSLHVGDMGVYALPAIAVVGASAPIAAGFAYSFKSHGTTRVACTFFGEGAANKGDIHEAMNLAAVWALPLIFVCENNMYAVSTPLSQSMRNETVAERAAAYGMPGVTVYGNDPTVVYDAVSTAAARARSGEGPTLIECLTYRRGGHKRDDPATYRPREEVEAWLAQDPVSVFRRRLLTDAGFEEAELAAIDVAEGARIADAAEFAQESPSPHPSTAEDYVYA
jgi:TPP-dependent pyruvate/acetoin dehydrogenase alpha subunit